MAINYIKHFNKHTEPIGDYRLLILDGHGSHATFQFRQYAHDNKIILLYLPAHTTHKLQPLDVGIFGPQANFYSQEVDRYFQWNREGVTQREYIEWILKARDKANTESNILSAWKKSGLIPFDPNIVLDKLKKPKKYTSNDEPPPPPPLAKPIETLLECENRPVTPYAMVSIIVGTKTIRFPVDDSTYLDYMIGKLSTATPSIAIHRANVKAYIDYKVAQERIKAHELNLIRKAVANKKKRSKKTVGYSVVDPETWETILEAEKSAQAKKEANAKEIAQKKDQSAKKKAAAEVKKIAAAANRVTNKAAKAAEEATKAAEKIAAKTNPKNNRKDKKAGHSQNIEGLKDAIQHLFLKSDSEAKTIEEENVVEQLNIELQAATNEISRNKSKSQRTTRAPSKRYL
jgi:hypothetical protein